MDSYVLTSYTTSTYLLIHATGRLLSRTDKRDCMALHAQPSLAHLAMRRGLGGSPALIHVKLAPRTELYITTFFRGMDVGTLNRETAGTIP
ncbi:hypothetical protein ACJQWK_06116 [Exserohilum turcicum]